MPTRTAPATVSLNDTLTYTFTATNTGDVTLTNVTIADPLAGLSALTLRTPTQPSTLAPAASMVCTRDVCRDPGRCGCRRDHCQHGQRRTRDETPPTEDPDDDVPVPQNPALDTGQVADGQRR